METKKSIGLLTMPIKENYGGIIQIAALYHFLEKNDYKPYLIMKRYDEGAMKIFMRSLLAHNPLYTIYDYKNLTKREKQSFELHNFVNDFFKRRTRLLFNKKQYVRHTLDFETVIVGSDQVWRYKYVKENYRYYFLDFLPERTKRIAYAASFGVGEWEGNDNTVEKIRGLLKEFDAVSVREKSGLEICKESFNYSKAIHVLDPTFLPDIDFYNAIINSKGIKKKVELFSYVLDISQYINEVVSYTAESLNLDISTIKLTDYKFSVNPSISEWLYNFREAEFVITDSFHGVVFCILFEKQFICIGNKERGYTRFESLLGLLNLQDRMVFNFNSSDINRLLRNKINYEHIESIKKTYTKTSKEFLLNALNAK